MSELGTIGVWGHLDSLSARRVTEYAGRAERLGYRMLWVPETVGREPFALLGTLAATTRTIGLGTSIASIWARDAVTMRCAAISLHELSAGRFVLGLGVSHHHLAEKVRGHRYERPLTRMREYLAAYRGAPYRGPVHEPQPEPPIVLAALRERMLDLAAIDAAGAFPYLVTAARARWMRERLDAAASADPSTVRPALAVTLPVVLETDVATARATARAYLTPYLRTPNYHGSWTEQGFDEGDWERPGSDRLVDAMV
ncbi:MAG: LLM class flavin-dependent oxidoreductase, partial [Chloroflexota bacterium]|nr:LLM class flavin-dependent oxidoreductase [Chloroflexota bacterium]